MTTVNPGPIETSSSLIKLIHLEPILRVLRSLSSVLNTWLKKIVRILGKNKREVNLPRLFIGCAQRIYAISTHLGQTSYQCV